MEQGYDFGLILLRLRKEKGWTQEHLANLIHKDCTVISKYEKNNKIQLLILSENCRLYLMFQLMNWQVTASRGIYLCLAYMKIRSFY